MDLSEKKKIIWLTWERQIRNQSMATGLKIPLFEIVSSSGRIARYVSCIRRTLRLLWSERPAIVICQNPSRILTSLLLNLRIFFRFKVVIDAHYDGVEINSGSKILQKFLDYCNRCADLVIVTNEDHAKRIEELGGKIFVCPDPLPDLSEYHSYKEEIFGKVFFICSFDPDEPFLEIFRAAEIIRLEGFLSFASGNYKKMGIVPEDFPQIKLLGFIPEKEFYMHLFSAQVVVDLTNNDNCLVCGAYEALEARKPLVLSRKKALQKYFSSGTVFTENQAKKIAAAIKKAHAKRLLLKEDGHKWVSQEKLKMMQRLTALRNILKSL